MNKKSNPKAKPPKRSPDQTTLTISMPKKLREQIEQAAKADNRTTSNFVVTELAKKLGISLSLIATAFLRR